MEDTMMKEKKNEMTGALNGIRVIDQLRGWGCSINHRQPALFHCWCLAMAKNEAQELPLYF